MAEKTEFDSDEQVLIRFRGKSSAPDGVYGLLKLLEGDELYQSATARHRAVVALAPYLMMRDAARQLPQGAMDEVFSRMNSQTLALFRGMFEEFRQQSSLIEQRLNQELVARSVTEAKATLVQALADKVTFATRVDVERDTQNAGEIVGELISLFNAEPTAESGVSLVAAASTAGTSNISENKAGEALQSVIPEAIVSAASATQVAPLVVDTTDANQVHIQQAPELSGSGLSAHVDDDGEGDLGGKLQIPDMFG